MTYKIHETIPDYEAPEWAAPDSAEVINRYAMKWGGLEKNGTSTPPAIGQRIYVPINKLGPATVRGYFSEDDWLGLLVEFHEPPEWWIRQNSSSKKLGHVFGPEFRIVE